MFQLNYFIYIILIIYTENSRGLVPCHCSLNYDLELIEAFISVQLLCPIYYTWFFTRTALHTGQVSVVALRLCRNSFHCNHYSFFHYSGLFETHNFVSVFKDLLIFLRNLNTEILEEIFKTVYLVIISTINNIYFHNIHFKNLKYNLLFIKYFRIRYTYRLLPFGEAKLSIGYLVLLPLFELLENCLWVSVSFLNIWNFMFLSLEHQEWNCSLFPISDVNLMGKNTRSVP